MATSSSIPQFLLSFEEDAQRIQGDLVKQANWLEPTLQRFTRTCTEYNLGISENDAEEVYTLASMIGGVGSLVGAVANRYEWADRTEGLAQSIWRLGASDQAQFYTHLFLAGVVTRLLKSALDVPNVKQRVLELNAAFEHIRKRGWNNDVWLIRSRANPREVEELLKMKARTFSPEKVARILRRDITEVRRREGYYRRDFFFRALKDVGVYTQNSLNFMRTPTIINPKLAKVARFVGPVDFGLRAVKSWETAEYDINGAPRSTSERWGYFAVNLGFETGVSAGSAAVGGAIGAALGALIGACFAGVGAAPGALMGARLGSFVGSALSPFVSQALKWGLKKTDFGGDLFG
jgi:hypothetical protein